MPLQALAIPERVESVVLHGIEFCIGVHGAETAFNRMQAGWARSLLGCSRCFAGGWSLLIAEVGWKRRLGTRMLERAVMLHARAMLSSHSHPARRILEAARFSSGTTWHSQVMDVSYRSDFIRPIPCILETLSDVEVSNALSCKRARKFYLRRYRRAHVSPVLDAYDGTGFSTAASNQTWPYVDFQPFPERLPDILLRLDWGPQTWYFYRAWSITRVLGKLPLAVFGGNDPPRCVSFCPLCGCSSADVLHVLHACPATWDLYCDYCTSVGLDFSSGVRIRWSRLRLELFADRISFLDTGPTDGAARIHYVGRAMQRVARLLVVDDDAVDDFLQSCYEAANVDAVP